MSDALVLISGKHEPELMRTWLHVSQFQACVLHRQKLDGCSTSSGNLEFIPYTLPSLLDPKDITGAAIIDFESGKVSTVFGFQVPFEGLFQFGKGWGVCARGWCLPSEQPDEYESDCVALIDDPCALARELWCCYHNLRKGQTISISFRDMQKRYQPQSTADRQELKKDWLEAKAECDRICNKGSTFRGGHLGHSCGRC